MSSVLFVAFAFSSNDAATSCGLLLSSGSSTSVGLILCRTLAFALNFQGITVR